MKATICNHTRMKRARYSLLQTEVPREMTLDEALYCAQAHGYTLIYDDDLGIELWTGGRKVSLSLRRTIFKHRGELAAMMRAGDSRCCPAPLLHKPFWNASGAGRVVCEMCCTLEPGLS